MLLLLLHGSSELVALDFIFFTLLFFRLAFGITDSSEFGSVMASLNGTFAWLPAGYGYSVYSALTSNLPTAGRDRTGGRWAAERGQAYTRG
jgi:hypothetical protein